MKHWAATTAALILLWVGGPGPLRAWSEHAPMSYQALLDLRELDDRTVTVESLEDFIEKERGGLSELFAGTEATLRREIPNYAPHPDAVLFPANTEKTQLRARFLRAARLSPVAKLPLYVYVPPGTTFPGRRMATSDMTRLKDAAFIAKANMVAVTAGQRVPARLVLAGASDEPDMGLDIGLFSDSKTEEGRAYGFGEQPFGNPNLEYGTQAPFHMGFYHEAGIVYKLGPFLGRTNAEYRIRLFHALSRFAFQKGHEYWGLRFMGWGLHYIQDLTQPYHSVVLPGVSTLRMLWTNLLAILGFPKAKNEAIQLVSNRHTAIEAYQYRRMLALGDAARQAKSAQVDPLVAALRGAGATPFTPANIRGVISTNAAARAAEADRALVNSVPSKLVSDPTFELGGTKESETIVAIVNDPQLVASGRSNPSRLEGVLVELFREYGVHTRGFAKSLLPGMSAVK